MRNKGWIGCGTAPVTFRSSAVQTPKYLLGIEVLSRTPRFIATCKASCKKFAPQLTIRDALADRCFDKLGMRIDLDFMVTPRLERRYKDTV